MPGTLAEKARADTAARNPLAASHTQQRPSSVAEVATLRKAAAAIHIRNDISCLQRKLWNVLLSNAYLELPTIEIQVHKMRIRELAAEAGFDSKNLGYLKKALEDMVSTKVVWNILGDDKEGSEWGVTTALASAVIRDGYCWYTYSSHLRAKLHDPEFYAPVQLGIVKQFGSGRALALYENCLRYQHSGVTPVFKIDVFRALLGVGDNNSYDDFKVLNRSVIRPSVEEVNTVSDINLAFELERSDRKVTGIRFRIARQEQATLPIEAQIEFDAVLLHALQETFCLSDVQAKEALVLHSEERLRAVMAYVEERYEAGKIKQGKIAPYFLRTLASWSDVAPTSAIDRQKEETLARVNASRDAALQAQAIKDRFSAQRSAKVDDYLASLEGDQRAALIAEFEADLLERNATMLRAYRKSGLRGLAKLELSKFVARRILGPVDEEWAKYAQEHGLAPAA